MRARLALQLVGRIGSRVIAPLPEGGPRPRPSRRSPDGGRTGPAPPSAATAAGAQRRTAGGGYFASRCKAGRPGSPRGLPRGVSIPAVENSRRPPLRARAACRPIALSKAAGAARSGKGAITANRCDRQAGGRAAHFIVPFRPRPSISGIEARLARQAARARLFEDDPRPDGGGLR